MKRLLLLILILPLFVGQAWAEDIGAQAMEIFDAGAMADGLSEDEVKLSGELAPGRYDAGAALSRLLRAFAERLRTELRDSLGFAAQLLSVLFFCSFACAVCAGEKQRELIEICAACALTALLTGSVNTIVREASQAMYRLSDYSKAALPVVYTAAAAGGAVSSAAVRYAASSLALDVMMSLSQKAVIPLVYAALALSLANGIFPNSVLASVEQLLKRIYLRRIYNIL